MRTGLLIITLLFCFQSAIAKTETSFFDHIKQIYQTDGIQAVLSESKLQRNTSSPNYKFNVDQLNQLGYELLAEDKADDAIQLFTLNIELYPEDWNIKDSLAEGYLSAGKLQQALTQYQYTFSLLGTDEHDNWNRKWTVGQLEKVYTQLDKSEAILPLYQQEVELNPYADWAMQRMGEVLLERNQLKAGIAYLNLATDMQASPDFAWSKLADFYRSQSNNDYTTFIEQTWAQFPYLASSWDQLALRLIETDNEWQAESIIEQGLTLFPRESFWKTAKNPKGLKFLAKHQQAPLKGSFSAMGCGPYRKVDANALSQYIQIENSKQSSVFMIHLGDIVGYHGDVPESKFSDTAKLLSADNQIPTFSVLGDNEWNDSWNPEQSLRFWKQHLGSFHERFELPFHVNKQQVREENFSFVNEDILYIGINLPAGKVHDKAEWTQRITDNGQWIQQNLNNSNTLATVIMAQGSPEVFDGLLLEPLKQAASKYTKPILFLHADGHKWFYRTNEWAENIVHVQVDKLHSKAPHYPPIQIHFTGNKNIPFVFDRRISSPIWKVQESKTTQSDS